jgi:striatin 1/3/4
MASGETYDGTPATGVNAVVATSLGLEGSLGDSGRGLAEEENLVHGATGTTGHGGVEGVIISGHEDQFIRFFDANSGMFLGISTDEHVTNFLRPMHV